MDKQTVLNKIQKLLNLANHPNRFIEEADTAMAMAHKLLKKHHLTMSQVMVEVDSDGFNSNDDMFQLTEIEAVSYKANKLPKWMATLIMSVNKVTETKTLIKRIDRPGSLYCDLKILYVGDDLDAYTASELFNYLRTTVTKLSSKHVKEVNGKFKQWRSFAEGCSNRLLERAIELNSDLQNKLNLDFDSKYSVDSFSLSDDEDYEHIEDDIDDIIGSENYSVELYNKYQTSKAEKIIEYIENNDIKDENITSRAARKTDEESFEQGREAAEDIPLKLAQQLGSKSKRRRHRGNN